MSSGIVSSLGQIGLIGAHGLAGQFDPPAIRCIAWPQLDASGKATFNQDGAQIFQSLFGYVPITEAPRDELIITEHPVEQGATIADHAFKRPTELTMRIGFTNVAPIVQPGTLVNNLVNAVGGFFGGSPGLIQRIYSQLLLLQANRTLVTIYTGKRVYENMILMSIAEETGRTTEFALIVTIRARQFIFVNTQLVSVPSSLVMKTPQLNTAPQNNGTQQLQSGSGANTTAFPPGILPGQ